MEPPPPLESCALACSLLVAAFLNVVTTTRASIKVAEFGLVENSLPVPSFTLPAHAPADPPRGIALFEIGSPAGVDFADAFQRAIPLKRSQTLTIKHTVPGPVPGDVSGDRHGKRDGRGDRHDLP
ncbi:MAG: hypothetical protein R3F11_27765 [Verrucomicrobiales bacterium]